MKTPVLCLLLLSSCAGSSSSRSTTCQLPKGAAKIAFLLFRSDNREPYRPVVSEGIAPAETCQLAVNGQSLDAVAFTEQLDAHRCGGHAVTTFSGWNVRFYRGMNGEPDVRGVVESPADVQVLVHQTVGGMPGGAQDQQTFAIVFPPTKKPIVDCKSVTDLGHYSGPMPP